jgi:hypothetical protein
MGEEAKKRWLGSIKVANFFGGVASASASSQQVLPPQDFRYICRDLFLPFDRLFPCS